MSQTKSSMDELVNLHDFEAAARASLDDVAREYVSSGAADQITMRRNREAFDELKLHPRMLVDVSRIDTTLTLLDQALPMPILIAPTGYQRLFHPQGELETAAGAKAAGATMILSTVATAPVEKVSEVAGGNLWFQLYTQMDRAQTSQLIRRAEDAGSKALVVTVDTPVLGARDRERRLVFPQGERTRAVHLAELDPTGGLSHHFSEDSIYSELCNPMLTWKSIASIRKETRLPVLLKGVMSPEDARRAVDDGVDGLIVSNHGGRNLDTVPAAIEALPVIADAVQGRIPVLMDGGVRRGTDVLKALACGANAVCIGRPPLWGLAVGGSEGVAQVLRILHREFMAAMALCGVASLDRIKRSLIWND